MVIIKNSFEELCRQFAEKELTDLNENAEFILNHKLSVMFFHIKLFSPIMESILKIESKEMNKDIGVKCHKITPNIPEKTIVWREYKSNSLLYKSINPVMEFPFRWEVIIIKDKENNKSFGFISFLNQNENYPITKLYLAQKASVLDFMDIFQKIST